MFFDDLDYPRYGPSISHKIIVGASMIVELSHRTLRV